MFDYVSWKSFILAGGTVSTKCIAYIKKDKQINRFCDTRKLQQPCLSSVLDEMENFKQGLKLIEVFD